MSEAPFRVELERQEVTATGAFFDALLNLTADDPKMAEARPHIEGFRDKLRAALSQPSESPSPTQSTGVPEEMEALAKRLFDSISESRKSWHMQGAKVRAHYRDAAQKHLTVIAPALLKQGAEEERERLKEGVRELDEIAMAAWRARETLHLNIIELCKGLDGTVTSKNLIDAINDLNEHMPLSEDGHIWRMRASLRPLLDNQEPS